MEPSENEIKFKLEQYRALDNKIPIKVVLTEKVNIRILPPLNVKKSEIDQSIKIFKSSLEDLNV